MAKRIIAPILSVLLLFSCISTAFAAVLPARYIVSADYASVYKQASEESTLLCTVARNTYLQAIREQNGFLLVNVPSQELAGWVKADSLTLSDPSIQTDITRIYVATKPSKTVYIAGEESFDPSGMTVKAVKKDKSETVISGYSVYTESFASPGEKKVTVQYKPQGTSVVFSDSFCVTVNRIPLKALTAESLPKTSYIENTMLELSGIRLRASYTDGRADSVFDSTDIFTNEGFTVTVDGRSVTEKLTVGNHTVKIEYKYPDITCSYDIIVRNRRLQSFSVVTMPDTMTVYSLTEAPSLEGLTMKAVFDNGESLILKPSDCTVLYDLGTFRIGTGNIVTVSYGTKNIFLDFTIRPVEEKRLKVTTPKVLTFILGEKIDLSGLKVELEYTDGSLKEVTDYTISKINPLIANRSQQVVVSYGRFSEIFSIYITSYFQRGDVDGDGKVSVNDARYTLRQSIHIINLSPTSKNYAAADADRDGQITVNDARLILRASIGLKKLPLALN